MELPSHPESHQSGTDPEPASSGWGTRIVIGVLIALVAAVVVLHLIGFLGPGAHGL
jgi:hypothetical protein